METTPATGYTPEQAAMLEGANRLQALLESQQDAVEDAALAACECPLDADEDPDHPSCRLAPEAGGGLRLEYCPTARRLLLHASQGGARVVLAFQAGEAEHAQLQLAALLLAGRQQA